MFVNKWLVVVGSLVFLLLAGLFSSANAQIITPEQRKSAAEVMATLAVWADAVRDRDAKALELLFADDLVITTHDGKVRGKKEELEVLKPNPNLETVAIENEDVGIKVFGDAAVVTALTKMRFVASGKESQVAMRYTAVFVKRDGRWQIVALQTARVPQTP